MRTIRTYNELLLIPDYEERYEYVKLGGIVGEETFGDKRWMNQALYSSREWKDARREVILRDEGYDLAHKDYPIMSAIYVHHLNPITIDDILEGSKYVFDPFYLVSVSLNTHNALHYGSINNLKIYKERSLNDTCPWKKGVK